MLVAGKQGQLARSLAERGPLAGIEVIAVGRPELDLCMPRSIDEILVHTAPDIIVNAAAYTAVDKAETEQETAFLLNRDGAGALAAAAARAKLPLIHVSTDYVFDGTKGSPYVETDGANPLGVYGRSKFAGEVVVADKNAQHVILRTAWVHSPFGHNFVKTILGLISAKPELRVVADQTGNPTYALHLADVVLSAAQSFATSGDKRPLEGIFHAAGAGDTTWHGLASAVVAQASNYGYPAIPVIPITTQDFPTAAARPADTRLDCGRLKRLFGCSLPDWREGVAECVRRLCMSGSIPKPNNRVWA